MTLTFRPKGVCSQLMRVELEDGIITNMEFMGGCNGNLQGISKLVVGRTPEDVISCLSGIKCGFKSTSCPDQLAQGLAEALKNNG